MKLMVIASLYSSETPSGENLFVRNLQETLNRYEIQNRFFTVDTGKQANKKIYKLKVALIQVFNCGNSPLKEIRNFRPDVILISNLFPNISTRWLKKNVIPVIYFQHNFRINCISGTFSRNGEECFLCISKNSFQGIKYKCYKKSRLASLLASIRIITGRNRRIEMKFPTNFLALHEKSVYPLEKSGIQKSRIRVLNNYLPEVPLKSYNREQKVWLYCGRISEEKGIIQLLAIWPDDQSLEIYGEGPLVNDLRKLTIDRPNIKYKGMIPNEQLTSILHEFVGAIFPSTWREGFPLVVLEYLRAGLPIATTKGNNVSQIIKLAQSGMDFKVGDREELNAAISQILECREIFSNNAIRHFNTHYSEETWIRKLETIIEEVRLESLRV